MMYRSAASDDYSYTERSVPKHWYRQPTTGRLSSSSIEWAVEAMTVPQHQDLAISPGQVVDHHYFETRRAKGNLRQAIDFFRSHGSYSADDRLSRISETSRVAAIRFIDLLPSNVSLPKVAPDGEAGVMFYWSFDRGDVVVTVDQNLLHCVVGAGAPGAIYYEDLVFEGDSIPDIILGALQE